MPREPVSNNTDDFRISRSVTNQGGSTMEQPFIFNNLDERRGCSMRKIKHYGLLVVSYVVVFSIGYVVGYFVNNKNDSNSYSL